MTDIITTKKILRIGNSLAVILTKELKMFNIDEGDIVEIRISKLPKEKE